MKKIKLTQGKFALVDDEDYETVNSYKWNAYKDKNTWYAKRWFKIDNGKRFIVRMQNFIFKCPDGMVVDHKNGNGLDNRKENLRVATLSQNVRNRRILSNNTSGYKGVSYSQSSKKWMATIKTKGGQVYLGVFINKKDAARAYNRAALEHYGEFARLNKV